jgi:hypothetical protein
MEKGWDEREKEGKEKRGRKDERSNTRMRC